MGSSGQQNEELRRRSKDAAHQAAFEWIRYANERLLEINRQLLGVATILLPLTGSIVLAPIKIGESEKTLLIVGWVSIFISIIVGFIQLTIETAFLKRWARYESKREEIFSDPNRSYEDMIKEAQLLQSPSEASTHIPLAIQIFTLFGGLILVMAVAIGILLFNE